MGKHDNYSAQILVDDNGNKYKVKKIWDNTIYTKKSNCHLLKPYYLIL